MTTFDLFDIRARRVGCCSSTTTVGTVYDELDGLKVLMVVTMLMMMTVMLMTVVLMTLVHIFNQRSREITSARAVMNSYVRAATSALVAVGDALLRV